jgi:predicted metal-binding membrane protein
MGMHSMPSFLATWTAMTAAMMAPSALPFIVSFGRRTRRWPLPTLVAVTLYLLVWATFGLAAYLILRSAPMVWPAGVVAGVAIAFVGLYSFTPLKRMGQARCIAMCRREETIDGLGLRAGLVEGATYGLSCVCCSAGVMVAVIVVGLSSIVWMAAGSALIVLYKIAGSWPRRLDWGISTAMVLAGIWLIAV